MNNSSKLSSPTVGFSLKFISCHILENRICMRRFKKVNYAVKGCEGLLILYNEVLSYRQICSYRQIKINYRP